MNSSYVLYWKYLIKNVYIKYSNSQYDPFRAHDNMGYASGTLPSSSKRCTDQSHNHQYTSVGNSEDFKTGKKLICWIKQTKLH